MIHKEDVLLLTRLFKVGHAAGHRGNAALPRALEVRVPVGYLVIGVAFLAVQATSPPINRYGVRAHGLKAVDSRILSVVIGEATGHYEISLIKLRHACRASAPGTIVGRYEEFTSTVNGVHALTLNGVIEDEGSRFHSDK
jgi:hypothetical protein